MKIGVLGSSGGSAFAAFHDIVAAASPGRHTFVAVSDRAGGFEQVCRERGIPLLRSESGDNDAISGEAAAFLAADGDPDIVLLYFLRLVTEALYERFATFNIHPSLLPEFPGFRPLEQALAAGASRFGATLHQVDASVDGGPVVAQIGMPLAAEMTIEDLEKRSYLQKVYCALLLVDLIERGALRIDGPDVHLVESRRGNPALENGALLEGFRELQRVERIEVVP